MFYVNQVAYTLKYSVQQTQLYLQLYPFVLMCIYGYASKSNGNNMYIYLRISMYIYIDIYSLLWT